MITEKPKKESHGKLYVTLQGLLIVIVLIFLKFAYISLKIPLACKKEDISTTLSHHSFVLKQIHKHSSCKGGQLHQKLDITADLADEAGKIFREEQFKLLSDESSDDNLWTTNEKFSTDNPFNYRFHLASNIISLKRTTQRNPEYIESYLQYARESPKIASRIEFDWVDEDVVAPNITDKDTVISLALMASNAYVRLPHTGNWRNVSLPWNLTEYEGFGWDSDGLRGHVFHNEEDNIVVLSFKGTSAQGIPGAGEDETTLNDKLNDNLLFSCCCARVSYLWNTVCDCYIKSSTCDESCLEKELIRKDRYYSAVLEIYKDVIKEYPDATIWLTGHSLGGALASLLGRTFGLPAVTFEAPGEYLATKRLHLPYPPGLPEYMEGVWHFGHTADPIFMGTCNGASSSCSIAGYAMETSCHTGKVCVYDVVKDKGWHVNMLNHRIHKVIDEILTKYDEVTPCLAPEPCVDCYNWKYWRSRDEDPSKITSKSSTVRSSTTTSKASPTCIGRNWLGICTEYGPIDQVPIPTTS